MIRFGCALQLQLQTTDIPTRIYTRCSVAVQHGLGVIRIPPHVAHVCPSKAWSLVQAYIAQHQLRVVIHAPMADITTLIPELTQYALFLQHIKSPEAVIICHVPHLDMATVAALQSLDPAIRQYLAIEHTHQPPDSFMAFIEEVELPPIFDWLHYHLMHPWPYQPDITLCDWGQRWRGRRPLWHMSTQSEHGSTGQHSTRIDSAVMIWMLRRLNAHGMHTDVELETPAGITALHRLRHDIQLHAPELTAWIASGGINAHS